MRWCVFEGDTERNSGSVCVGVCARAFMYECKRECVCLREILRDINRVCVVVCVCAHASMYECKRERVCVCFFN